MRDYFAAEKIGGVFFMSFGVASLTFGALAMWRGGRGFRAAAGPALDFGAIQLAILRP